MFVSVPAPAEPGESGLGALRLSLNSPVVSHASLPMGPARAAIALHEAEGGPRVTVALRSERSGERFFFVHEDGGEPIRDAGLLLDAALSFAEGMGFLFDDDEVESRGDAGPADALSIWREFSGLGPGPAGDSRAAPAPPPAAAQDALLLTKFRWRIGEALLPPAKAGARIQLLGRF